MSEPILAPPAPEVKPDLHERLAGWPQFLSSLLTSLDPWRVDEDHANALREVMSDYARSSTSDPRLQPIVDVLEGEILAAFDTWLHRAPRRKYAEYLATEGWERKRELVLRRANYVCEGCGEARATQVHHTTYEHRGDEFLFELLALCGHCHARISAKDGTHES